MALKSRGFFPMLVFIGVIGLAATSYSENKNLMLSDSGKESGKQYSVEQKTEVPIVSSEAKTRSLSKSSKASSSKGVYKIRYQYDLLGRIKRVDRLVEPLDAE